MEEIKMESKLKHIIQLEGVDAVGKSLISNRLKEIYKEEKGYNVFSLHFPVYDSPTGKIVKDFLTGKLVGDPVDVNPIASSLYYTTDRLTYFRNNPNIFTDYDVLIFDRSYMSNFFFQTAKYMHDEPNYLKNIVSFIYTFYPLEIGNTPLKNFGKLIRTFLLRHPSIEINFELMKRRGGAEDLHESNKEYLKMVDDNSINIMNFLSNSQLVPSLSDSEHRAYSSIEILCSSLEENNEGFMLRNIDDICNDIIVRME